MAKYLTEFNTYAEYQAATLNLPNVSLIKSTGKVYYKNIFAGASLGDILMWDNVNNKLVTKIAATNLSSTSGRLWTSTTLARSTDEAYVLINGSSSTRLKTQDADGARAMLAL